MALRDWMVAFNNAKEMEANGEQGAALMAEYERVISKLLMQSVSAPLQSAE